MPEVKLKFTSDTAQAVRGIDKLKGSLTGLKNAGAGIGKVLTKGLMALTAGITATGLAAGKGLKDIIDFSGEIKDISDSTGISISSLIELREQFRQAGVDVSRVQFVLAALSNEIQNPGTETVGWLEQFNLNLQDLQKMGIEERFEVIRKKISELGSEAERLKASKDFFGKAGADLVRLFSDVEAKVNAKKMLGDLPQTMALIAGTLESAGDKFDGLSVKWNQFFAGFASQLLGPIKKAADFIESLDLTQFGVRAGMLVNGLIESFKDGTLVDTIGSAFLGGLIKVLAEIGTLLSYVLIKAFIAGGDALANKYPFFKRIGEGGPMIEAPQFLTDIENKLPHAMTYEGMVGKPNNTPQVAPNFSQFRDAFRDEISGLLGYSNDLLKPMMNMSKTGYTTGPVEKQGAEFFASLKEKAFANMASERNERFKYLLAEHTKKQEEQAGATNWAQNFLGVQGVLDFANKKPDEKVESAYHDIEPVVSSLARIGGAAGETNSVANFQKTSLMYQKQMVVGINKMSGGAIIG